MFFSCVLAVLFCLAFLLFTFIVAVLRDCAYVSGSNDVGARLRAAVEANRDHYIAEGCGLFDVEDGCC